MAKKQLFVDLQKSTREIRNIIFHQYTHVHTTRNDDKMECK